MIMTQSRRSIPAIFYDLLFTSSLRRRPSKPPVKTDHTSGQDDTWAGCNTARLFISGKFPFSSFEFEGVMENTDYWKVTGAAPTFDGQIRAKIGYKSYEKEMIMPAEEGMLVGVG